MGVVLKEVIMETISDEELKLLEKSLDGITPPFIQVEANSNVRNILPRLLRAYRKMKSQEVECSEHLFNLSAKYEAQLAQKEAALQDAILHADDFVAECKRKDAVIEKMKVALEFYGNQKTYIQFREYGINEEKTSDLRRDEYGNQARQCLDELKGGKEG